VIEVWPETEERLEIAANPEQPVRQETRDQLAL
jgi:hypothetical protein